MSSGGLATGWVRKPHNQDAVVLFVHGIISGGIGCWTASNGAYWPKMLAEEEALSSIGIFVFSYRTAFTSSTYDVGDIVDSLREEMKLSGLEDFRRIIFVCHSMGGIVVRRFLVMQQVNLIERGTRIGLFLLASPSLGSPHASLLYSVILLAGNQQAKVLHPSQRNAWLKDLDKDFIDLLGSQRISITGKELVEDKPITFARWRFLGLRLLRQTVLPSAAARYFGQSFKVPASDHLTICKPQTVNDYQHRVLVSFISTLPASSTGRIAMSITKGFTFESVARILVDENDEGAVLVCDQLTVEERNAAVEEKRVMVSSIPEGLELLGKLATPKIRSYRVEYIEREYRLIIN